MIISFCQPVVSAQKSQNEGTEALKSETCEKVRKNLSGYTDKMLVQMREIYKTPITWISQIEALANEENQRILKCIDEELANRKQ